MIDFTEKGEGLIDALSDAGFSKVTENGVINIYPESGEIEAQAIIDNYDPLPKAKTDAIVQVKIAASKKVHAIYPFVDPESEQAVGLYNFATDLYLSTIPAGREPISGRLLEFKTVYDVTVAGIGTINTETDWEQCPIVANTIINQIKAI